MHSTIHSQWSPGQAPQLPQLPQLPPAVLHLNAALALSELAFRSEIYLPLHFFKLVNGLLTAFIVDLSYFDIVSHFDDSLNFLTFETGTGTVFLGF
jgi:hypothetical protein